MKIINDPVHSFIIIKDDFILKLINSNFFQRLRRIKQLGLVDYIYPNATHTRFAHALGAMHLMQTALDYLRKKGVKINSDECQASLIAILLHDIGHSPFSHTLEKIILPNISHEQISLAMMRILNQKYDYKLDLAISIFENKYPRYFFHQLVSGQFDMDRLDYLARDCYFTNVKEGKFGIHRLLLTLNVIQERLVIEEKSKYTLEHFLNARRLMYWQVYYHKTNIAVENLLKKTMLRLRYLLINKIPVHVDKSLAFFLQNTAIQNNYFLDYQKSKYLIDLYIQLDDYDIWTMIKTNLQHSDFCLKTLTQQLLYRKCFKCIFSNRPFEKIFIEAYSKEIMKQYVISTEESNYFYQTGKIRNTFYTKKEDQIFIQNGKNSFLPFEKVDDFQHIKDLLKIKEKYYFVFPHNISLQ